MENYEIYFIDEDEYLEEEEGYEYTYYDIVEGVDECGNECLILYPCEEEDPWDLDEFEEEEDAIEICPGTTVINVFLSE